MNYFKYICVLILSVSALNISTNAADVERLWENNAFGTGERMVFSLDYAFINAGKTVMTVDSIINVRGNDCYKIVSQVNSNKTFDLIFKVRDYVETNIDVKGVFSRRFFKKIREGGYKDHKEVIYEQERGFAHMFHNDVYKLTSDIKPCSQDILSALFYIRTLDFTVGDTLSISLHDVKKSYPLKVSVNRRENVKVPAGEFDCLVVEPFLESEGMFRSKGKMEIWLTDDDKKIPVIMRTYIKIIGHIDASLAEYTPGMPVEN